MDNLNDNWQNDLQFSLRNYRINERLNELREKEFNDILIQQGKLQLSRQLLDEVYVKSYLASTKEGDGTMDQYTELKVKIDSIDSTVRTIEKDVVSIKTAIDIKFDRLSDDIRDLKNSIQQVDNKVVSTANDLRMEMKSNQDQGITGKRFFTNTLISSAAALAAVVTVVITIFK